METHWPDESCATLNALYTVVPVALFIKRGCPKASTTYLHIISEQPVADLSALGCVTGTCSQPMYTLLLTTGLPLAIMFACQTKSPYNNQKKGTTPSSTHRTRTETTNKQETKPTSPTPLNMHPTLPPLITQLLIAPLTNLTLTTPAPNPPMRHPLSNAPPLRRIDIRPQLYDPSDPFVAADVYTSFRLQIRHRPTHEMEVRGADPGCFDFY